MPTLSAIGHYRITAELGRGGMGEVYRATDTKLNREVAIKVLPEAFAQDADRMARFTREAQVLAALNHPNIAAIYGVEERALVMELVEGPTLADRIAQGPIPLEEALPIARQMAEALEAAHEKGIVHRDLKPANIKLTAEGKVKVLDFGLARVAQPSAQRRPAVLAHPHHERHPGRSDPGHGGLHGAGAGARRGGRQARRHLGLRRGVVRDADWPRAICRVRRSPTRWPRC